MSVSLPQMPAKKANNSAVRSRKSKKSVSWDTVEVRIYTMVLSTNPAAHFGPAVELGWEYCLADSLNMLVDQHQASDGEQEQPLIKKPHQIQGRMTVDNYEAIRPSDCRRRKLGEMYLDGRVRHELLEADYTIDEIQEAIREKITIARTRANSKTYVTSWMRDKQKRIRKVKRAVKNLQRNQVPKNIYSWCWLHL